MDPEVKLSGDCEAKSTRPSTDDQEGSSQATADSQEDQQQEQKTNRERKEPDIDEVEVKSSCPILPPISSLRSLWRESQEGTVWTMIRPTFESARPNASPSSAASGSTESPRGVGADSGAHLRHQHSIQGAARPVMAAQVPQMVGQRQIPR